MMETLFSKTTRFLHSATLSKLLSRALVILERGFSRNFEKLPFNWSCGFTVYYKLRNIVILCMQVYEANKLLPR